MFQLFNVGASETFQYLRKTITYEWELNHETYVSDNNNHYQYQCAYTYC